MLYVTPVFCPLRWTSEENIFARGDKIFLKAAKIYLYLALDNNDPALVVHADAAGVLEYVRAKLPDELSVLVVDLNLMRGRPGGRQNINLLPQQISQINIIHAIYLFAEGGRGTTLLIAGVGLTVDGLMWTLPQLGHHNIPMINVTHCELKTVECTTQMSKMLCLL